MGIKRQVCTGLLDLDRGVTWVTIDKAHLGMRKLREDIVTIRYVKGWRRRFVNMLPDTAFDEVKYPLEKCYFHPMGFINGEIIPDKTNFIFGLCHIVEEEKTKQLKYSWKALNEIIEKADAYMKSNKETEDTLKDMQKKMMMLK